MFKMKCEDSELNCKGGFWFFKIMIGHQYSIGGGPTISFPANQLFEGAAILWRVLRPLHCLLGTSSKL